MRCELCVPDQMKRSQGFGLLEVLVATTILTVALAGLAQLFAIAARTNMSARTTTFAAVLAAQKMEELRGLTWGFDTLGQPVSDTTTDVSVVPEKRGGGTGLRPSPAGAIGRNIEGYCDFLDRNGASLGGGAEPPSRAAYIRRWSIEPLPTNPNNTLVLQVLVTRSDRGADNPAAGGVRGPDGARIVSVKTRKAT